MRARGPPALEPPAKMFSRPSSLPSLWSCCEEEKHGESRSRPRSTSSVRISLNDLRRGFGSAFRFPDPGVRRAPPAPVRACSVAVGCGGRCTTNCPSCGAITNSQAQQSKEKKQGQGREGTGALCALPDGERRHVLRSRGDPREFAWTSRGAFQRRQGEGLREREGRECQGSLPWPCNRAVATSRPKGA